MKVADKIGSPEPLPQPTVFLNCGGPAINAAVPLLLMDNLPIDVGPWI